MFFVLFLLASSFIAAQAGTNTKVWQPKGQSVDEWYSHPIKCPKTSLRFENDTLEFFEGYSHEREIIFARTGYYVFQDKGQVIIGDSPHISNEECANAYGKEVIVHSVKPQLWVSPDNWYSDTNGNPAKPDIEKIPCRYDEIVFNNSVTRVDMDGIFQLQMQRVSIGGKWLRAREFGSFFKTVPGQKMFDNCEMIEVTQNVEYSDISACQSNAQFSQSVVCEHVSCAPAKCIDPIRPLGFCCPICGGSIQADIHHNNKIDLGELFILITRKMQQIGYKDQVEFHSSYFNHNTKFILQISFVEVAAYTGDSVKVMKRMIDEVLRRKLENFKLLESGAPYDPTARVNTFAMIFLPLIFVCTLFFVAYKLSYDDNVQIKWSSLMNRVTGRSQFIFAQFENVMEDHEGRITISHTQPTASSAPIVAVEETGVECHDSGMEMVAGGPEDKQVMAKDKLDEIVETIGSTSNDSVSLISVDM